MLYVLSAALLYGAPMAQFEYGLVNNKHAVHMLAMLIHLVLL